MPTLLGATGNGLPGTLTITALHPAREDPNHAYRVRIVVGSAVLVDTVYAMRQYSRRFNLGHHWMLYIAKILQAAGGLPRAEVTLDEPTQMSVPLGMSGSIDWLRVYVIRDRRDPGLACVTLDFEPEVPLPGAETPRGTYVTLALRCPIEDVVAFGRDLEAEYEVARRKREDLGLMAWDELESEPEPAGSEGGKGGS
jgi:hypothetical protein